MEKLNLKAATTSMQRRLAFDIGANIGQKTRELLNLGFEHIVAVEPLFDCPFPPTEKRVSWIKSLVSDSNLPQMIYPLGTISTCSQEFMATSRFKGQTWGEPVTVRSTTLDDLMDVYGIPDYIKIDCENYELSVIRGLPLRAVVPLISFEWHSEFRDQAAACVRLLESMGYSKFYLQFEDSLMLDAPTAQSAAEVMADFDVLCLTKSLPWGQIHCRL